MLTQTFWADQVVLPNRRVETCERPCVKGLLVHLVNHFVGSEVLFVRIKVFEPSKGWCFAIPGCLHPWSGSEPKVFHQCRVTQGHQIRDEGGVISVVKQWHLWKHPGLRVKGIKTSLWKHNQGVRIGSPVCTLGVTWYVIKVVINTRIGLRVVLQLWG